MPSSTVFLTGATGFIGAHVAALALRAGYNVKMSVRRESQIATLRQGFSDLPGILDFVVISDYTKENAFDTALQGVDLVIHLASPLPKPGEDLMAPAVKGTMSILESAKRVPSIKRVVITGSVASLIPLEKYGNDLVVTENIPKEKLEFDRATVSSLSPGMQYRASKLAAHIATLDFVENEKPHFSVVTLHPVYVFGQNLLQTSADEISGTNEMLFKSLFSEEPLFSPYRGVHIDDVAAAHVRALNLPAATISSYLLSARDRTWEEVFDFVRSKFPEAGFTGKPKSGERVTVETARAEAELGFSSWKEMEEQVVDVVEQQFKLRGT